MRPHSTPLDHEVSYFIDCAQDAGEMDACTAGVLRLYGDSEELGGVIESKPTSSYEDRLATCLDLASIADKILPRLPLTRRSGLVYYGLGGVCDGITLAAECLADWAIGDEVDGGYITPFKVRPRSRAGVPYRRTMRRLVSPDYIRRYVKNNTHNVRNYHVHSDTCVRRAHEFGSGRPDPTIRSDLSAQLDFRKRQDDRLDRASSSKDRRAVVRAWRTAVSVLGHEAVSSFVHGHEVRLFGREVALSVKRRGALTDRGHGCLSVGLMSRDGAELADLCTFIDSTPTLDQLTAFALWMGAGDDRGVLSAANITSTTPAGRAHPMVGERLRRVIEDRPYDRGSVRAQLLVDLGEDQVDRLMEMLDHVEVRGRGSRAVPPQLSYEQARARSQDYWEKTKFYWVAAAADRLVGRRNFSVYREAGLKFTA